MRIYQWLVGGILCLQSALCGWDNAPWLKNFLEFEGALSQEHRASRKIDTTHGTVHKRLRANGTRAALLFTPTPSWEAFSEVSALGTQSHHWNFEAVTLAARHQWYNDLVEDPVSVTTGLSFGVVRDAFVRDLSSLHHGTVEAISHVAVGKELGITRHGFFRVWGLGYGGVATRSAPWAGAEVHIDYSCKDTHLFSVLFQAEQGFSQRKLHRDLHFRGWGRIGYSYESLGLSYTYRYYSFGTFFIEVGKRLHAHFCPKSASIKAGIIIPWGL